MFDFWSLLFLVFGFFLLIKAADVLVDGAAGLAKKYGVPKMVIGLTLVAFGTSAPEGTVSLLAAIQGSGSMSVGNVIGSNTANVALVLGTTAILRKIPVRSNTLTKGVPLNILALIVLIVMGYDIFFQNGNVAINRLTLGDGIILLSFFVIFLYYIFSDLKAEKVQEKEIEKKERQHEGDPTWKLVSMSVGGLIGVVLGGKLVVDNAVLLATVLGVSQALIGLTLVAVGTSLPELVTSVVAALKKENDIAVGNIVGSNVFNVFLVLGITSVVIPLHFDPILLVDALFALFITVLFYIFLVKDRGLTKFYGAVLVFFYIGYLASLGFREVVYAFIGG